MQYPTTSQWLSHYFCHCGCWLLTRCERWRNQSTVLLITRRYSVTLQPVPTARQLGGVVNYRVNPEAMLDTYHRPLHRSWDDTSLEGIGFYLHDQKMNTAYSFLLFGTLLKKLTETKSNCVIGATQALPL